MSSVSLSLSTAMCCSGSGVVWNRNLFFSAYAALCASLSMTLLLATPSGVSFSPSLDGEVVGRNHRIVSSSSPHGAACELIRRRCTSAADGSLRAGRPALCACAIGPDAIGPTSTTHAPQPSRLELTPTVTALVLGKCTFAAPSLSKSVSRRILRWSSQSPPTMGIDGTPCSKAVA